MSHSVPISTEAKAVTSTCKHYSAVFGGQKEAIEREALDWNPQGKRRRGRPRGTWRENVRIEILAKEKRWNAVKRMAGNRSRGRCSVDDLFHLSFSLSPLLYHQSITDYKYT